MMTRKQIDRSWLIGGKVTVQSPVGRQGEREKYFLTWSSIGGGIWIWAHEETDEDGPSGHARMYEDALRGAKEHWEDNRED